MDSNYFERVPEEMKAILKTLFEHERANKQLIDWLITMWAERWSLEQRLGDTDRTLDRFLPPIKEQR